MNIGTTRRVRRGRDSEGVDTSGIVRERVDAWSVWAIAQGDDAPVRIADALDEADALRQLPRDIPAVIAEGEGVHAANHLVTEMLARLFRLRIARAVLTSNRGPGPVLRPRCCIGGCDCRASRARSDTPAWAVELCSAHRRIVSERETAGYGAAADLAAQLRRDGCIPARRRRAA